MTFQQLPVINAVLNSISAVLLVSAIVLIKSGITRAHAAVIIAAVITSAAFLASYLTYHYHVGEKSTKAMGLPIWLRTIYFAILFPHLILAIGMLPMILMTLWRAYTRQWEKHRKLAKPTFWIWLYVSVTGVVIYWMLYRLFPTMSAS
jgi:putative membrane protein